ncbi:aldehyde dehydrogenase family protein [Helicobacter saguini]|uniref:L-glutamate gamma-semialdehyde dehydrogenase n=1 Tax=Helicobacter saguini TaxID=1548018 RepID=A0A347VM32_9HELI|nr:bifunctional proline dehydrogenase/L-glutamate gamma-semialdehyde dehydrogenase [Helicobacter saguini]MWV61808.1 aldehyde dehydrogenase family protein [Helicobacter saguini]MWV67517.1 aldehyde dehydrogenase family protein [Helicobacter saguini]MWV69868.1 aldehyde dehydrogenase family protein [Helicobacter saguini]MWV72914.1 aldehyde dehydrogenase family protein [Helicobacter saguini]TLD93266.1 aldehyde dehydrogenase family protein [Helicobacter saguini]
MSTQKKKNVKQDGHKEEIKTTESKVESKDSKEITESKNAIESSSDNAESLAYADSTIKESIELAKTLQGKINSDLSCAEKRFRKKMMKMLENPASKIMLIELLDRSFRSKDYATTYELISYTLNKYGIADFFSPFEKLLLQVFLGLGKSMPSISVPFFIKNLKNDTKAMVLDENPIKLQKHAELRKSQHIGLNVNLIGEEVLGNLEANYRLQKYTDALNSSYINYISIKITTIFSQINILDFNYSKDEIVKRLDSLYAIAEQKQKEGHPKFINLDMEEFKDLELTVDSFIESISKFDIKAGIVLQAYLPDSYEYLKKLVEFSKKRVQSGKPPIKIRIVKGANMEAEETIASVKGWELPTFREKVNTDSNYNKMLNFVLSNENYKYINIGVASHNIFQIAYAMTRIKQHNAFASFTFEMLEGMNLKSSFEVAKTNNLILYAPVCSDAHFNNAIAYLVRRLDENTGKDNFMRYAFDLSVDSPAWKKQEEIFLTAINGVKSISNDSYRIQNRLVAPHTRSATLDTFFNEPDTDFIMPQNREWANAIKAKFENLSGLEITPIIGEKTPKDNAKEIHAKGSERVIGVVYQASKESIKDSIKLLKDSKKDLSFEELGQILLKTAEIVAERRNDLIGISALEVGKTFAETDAEVSEAIDFLRFYPHSMYKLLQNHKDVKLSPKGIGVVITPWNFPVAISVGGIAASLASGNRVIYKPSNLSAITGHFLTQCFYDAGLPKDYLVYLPASGRDINEIALKEADFSILTGGEDTAYKILEQNPGLFLSAETGGKNATIVSKMADRDQAAKNVIHSAFSNSGQKCSATSLLILEKEVYEDSNFRKTLIDAADSLSVGNPFDLKNKLGYLSDKIDSKVQKGLELESGEEWALSPSNAENNNPYAMRPCIKYGVKEGSYSHITEFFTPILSVMCARDLKHALAIANATGYGLTSGFESLDEREWEYYLENIQAGNIYINKPTTGAIVLRQAFGGIKKSAVGFGRKAGSYNYVTQFLNIESVDSIESSELNASHSIIDRLTYLLTLASDSNKKVIESVIKSVKSYAYFYDNEFSKKRDFVHIRGEDNLFYYKNVSSVIYRVRKEDSLRDILLIIAASSIANASLSLSFKPTEISEDLGFVLENLKNIGLTNINIEYQNTQSFIQKASEFELIRYLDSINSNNIETQEIYKGLIKDGKARGKLIANHKPYTNGYFELLYYFTERAASIAFHRYGNLGSRSIESKS